MWHTIPIQDTPSSAVPVVVDLGDFVAEEYVVRFSLNGNSYEIRYMEARVDEVIALLADAEKETESMTTQLAENRRRYVTELFTRNLVSGDAIQLASDLKTVPYVTLRGGMDIHGLYTMIQNRVKKKALSGVMEAQIQAPRGFLGRLRFW